MNNNKTNDKATEKKGPKGRNIYYLSARKDKDRKKEGWEVKMENCERISALVATKEEAIEKVKSLAGKKSATIIIRRLDGSIQDTIKYSGQK